MAIVADLSGNSPKIGVDYPLDPNAGTIVGYQQITSLSAATALTVPDKAASAIIMCEGASVRWRGDGTNPTASVGEELPVGGVLTLSDSLRSAKFIETAASAKLNVVYKTSVEK